MNLRRHKFQRTGSEYSLKEISMNNTSNLNQISTLNNRSGINKSLLNSFQSSIRQDPILSCLNSTLTREVKTEPIKVLDASGSINNFYFNPLDWSESNIVGICLGQQVALLNFKNDKSSVVSKIHHEDEMFSCFEWVPRSNYCSIGNSKGIVQIYDIVKKSVLRNIDAKIDNCINTMSFKSSTVAIGYHNGDISLSDLRSSKSVQQIIQKANNSHEICRLKWSPEENYLASGGGCGTVKIFDKRIIRNNENCVDSKDPSCIKLVQDSILTDHSASVKALSWCPWKPNILATGGGIDDGRVILWNTTKGTPIDQISTGSQISGIAFSQKYKEIALSHGYGLINGQITIWQVSNMKKISSIEAHPSRILSMSMNPMNNMIATLGADEILRFWDLFPEQNENNAKSIHGDDFSRING